MKTIALALAATTLASAPASAGVYVNTELNQGHVGSEYVARAIDIHVERGCLDILRVYAGVWDIARKASYILPFLAVMYWYWR